MKGVSHTTIVEQVYENYDFVTSNVGIWEYSKPVGVITNISNP
jgi:hypothetical protein